MSYFGRFLFFRRFRPGFWSLHLLATLVVLAFGWLAFVNERQSERHHEREAALREASAIARDLSGKFDDLDFVGERAANYLRWKPTPGPEEMKKLSEGLLTRFPFIRSLAFAPNLRVSRVFPPTETRPSVGTDYSAASGTREAPERALADRTPVFEYRARAGGTGTDHVLHYPVFVPGPRSGSDAAWGVVSIGLNATALLPDGHDPASSLPAARLLLEEKRMGVDRFSVVAGDRAVLDNDPESATEILHGSAWRVSVLPEAEWTVLPQNTLTIAGVTLLTAFLVNLLILAVRRVFQEKARSVLMIHDAVQALDQGILVFDRRGHLVATNHQASGSLREFVGELPRGVTHEQILRRWQISQRGSTDLDAEEEAWIRDRLATHGRGANSSTVRVRDDLWLKVSERPTRTGHLVRAYQDVTAEMRAQLHAEEASRRKSEFMAKVSHELRTPLTVIGGYATLIQQIPDPDLTHRNAERISLAASHMASLVESLLDWGEIKDRCMLERGEFSLGELAEEVGEDLRMLASAKGLALQVQACPAPVRADRFRMKQVLYNLVENAIRFTPAGEVTISVTEEAQGFRVAVRDTGVGIAETLRTSIFEAFNQADNSDSRRHNGLGLGLAIAQRIVERHGSRIEVFSTAGEGACFHFRLPASEVHKVIDMGA